MDYEKVKEWAESKYDEKEIEDIVSQEGWEYLEEEMNKEENQMEKNFKDYEAKTLDAIKGMLLPGEELKYQIVNRTNEVFHGISIETKGKGLRPVLYMEDCYKKDYDPGKIYEALKKEGPDITANELTYEDAYLNGFFRMINKDRNKHLLSDIVSIPILGTDIVLCPVIPIEGEGLYGTVYITNDMIDSFDMDSEEYYELLCKIDKNTASKIMVMSLNEKLKMLGVADGMIDTESPLWYAGGLHREAALCSESLKKISEKIGSCFIIPSSNEEVLLIKDVEGVGIYELKMLINEVNTTVLEDEKFLSNKLFYYNSQTGEINEVK